jgi:hypothetical protein
MIEKGTWVEIVREVLSPKERSNAIPDETKKTPLTMWVRGNTLHPSDLGEEVEIETISGRRIKGKVTQIEPAYSHGFGRYIGEVSYIGKQAREILHVDK